MSDPPDGACPGCEREDVELLGGLCGHCTTEFSTRPPNKAIEEMAFEARVYDVQVLDGFLNVRIDTGFLDGGEL